MSKEAPWIALAIDWQDSPMLDDTSHGERLAWICLLCFAKAQGRAGKVRLRGKAFAQSYRLSVESVEAMIAGAVKAGAVTVEGDIVTVVNWKLYQDPRVRSRTDENHRENESPPPNGQHFSKTSENDATKHPPPSTKHPPPERKARVFVKPTLADVEAYCRERGKGVNPQLWFDHYESNGWRVGRNPMKDWKSAVRKWEHSSFDNGQPAKPAEKPWHAIRADKFAALERAAAFVETHRSPKKPHHIRGTTKDGMRYECIDYPLPTEAINHAN